MLSRHLPHPFPVRWIKPQTLQPQDSPEHCRHCDLARVDASALMGPIAIVDVAVQWACDIYLKRIGESDWVTRGAHDVGEDAVVLGNLDGTIVVLDCHVNRGLTEETSGVTEAGAFHETGSVSWEVR